MLIVQGVFRSGTTTLFRTLRQDSQRCCFYEPLHPDLLDHVREANTEQPTHAKSPLYAEFTPLIDWLEEHYDPTFATRHAVLNENDAASELRAYLQLLARSSSRVTLQFNRGFWMSRWLRTLFPKAVFVHLVRDPRSVVWSQLTTVSGHRVRMKWPLLGRRYFNISSANLSLVFSPYAYHGAYHVKEYLELGRDVLGTAPAEPVIQWAFNRLRATRDARPYVQALALWGAQVRVCHHQAQDAFGDRYVLLRYEDLCVHPQRALEQIYTQLPDSCPSPVVQRAKTYIHGQRLVPWQDVEQGDEHFREGIQHAGIEAVLDEVGYDLHAS